MSLSGTGRLLGLYLRRDRLYLTVWFVALVSTVAASAFGTARLYPEQQQRVTAAEALNASGAVVALYGPIQDPNSLGELAMVKMTVLYSVLICLMVMFMIRRHTRAAEESGLSELILGAPVERNSPWVAALIESVAASVLVGGGATLASFSGGLPLQGSLLFGLAWAGTGIVFAAITLVACQIQPGSRAAAGVVAAAIGFFYALRAYGDVQHAWVRWLSPFAWNTQLQAWSHPRPWVLLLYLASGLVFVSIGGYLYGRRDLGSGLLTDRPGNSTGSTTLRSPMVMYLRLLRGSSISWTLGFLVAGFAFGAMVPGMTSLLKSPEIRQMMSQLGGEGALLQTMTSAILGVIAILAGCYAISVVTHVSDDEVSGRLQALLSAGGTRGQVYLSVWFIALFGSLFLMLLFATTFSIGGNLAGGRLSTSKLLVSALTYLPAIWITLAVALVAYAVRARLTALSWGFPILCLMLSIVPEMLGWPEQISRLSPYVATPKMPTEPLLGTPLIVMTALAIGLSTLGWLRFRSRDLY